MDTTNKAERTADHWTGNKGGYLTIRPSSDGHTAWVCRWRADGSPVDYIGPFSSIERAKSALRRLADTAPDFSPDFYTRTA